MATSDIRLERRARTTIVALTARHAMRSAAIWGALFGFLVFNEVAGYETNFPTAESRRNFAEFGTNVALTAIVGRGRRLDTIQGEVTWRIFGLLIIVGAIWGLLAATRLLRGEEEAGRWELLLVGRTSRGHATAQAITGLVAGWVVLWATTAAFTIAAGTRHAAEFAVSSSLFYATALTASGLMFLVVGAVAAQLVSTRRQANALAAGVFGVAFTIRMVADAVDGLGWLRWLSPLGWVENLHPLTGSQWLPLVPIGALAFLGGATAVVLADRRDLGVGILARPQTATSHASWLTTPTRLVVRLERWVAVAWIAGSALVALVFGVVAQSATASGVAVKSIEESVRRLGGTGRGATAWIGYEFVFVAALLTFAAATQVSAIRSEEADGHLDHLIARPVSRTRWLLGRLGFAAALVVLAALASGIGGWAGIATGDTPVALGQMLEAGVNLAVPAIFVLGLGTLLYGITPRLTVPIVYAVVLWSFVIEIIGASITTNHWILDSAVLTHLGPVPATDLNWTAIGALVGLAIAATGVGLLLFTRRDVASA